MEDYKKMKYYEYYLLDKEEEIYHLKCLNAYSHFEDDDMENE
jgi:hypothetical protein